MTRIAISGAVAELPRAIAACAAVRALGYDLVSTWTDKVAAAPDVHDRDLTDNERQRVALQDLEAVERCGVLWLLCPAERRGRGSWVELGYALALGRMVIVSGPDVRETIFTSLAARCFGTDEAALEWLGSRHESTRKAGT